MNGSAYYLYCRAAGITFLTRRKRSAFNFAVERGDLPLIEKIITTRPIYDRQQFGRDIIECGCNRGYILPVVWAINRYGRGKFRGAIRNKHRKLTLILLRMFMSRDFVDLLVETSSCVGWFPMFKLGCKLGGKLTYIDMIHTLRNGHHHIVRWWIFNYMPDDIKNETYYTLLAWAIRQSDIETVQKLIGLCPDLEGYSTLPNHADIDLKPSMMPAVPSYFLNFATNAELREYLEQYV